MVGAGIGAGAGAGVEVEVEVDADECVAVEVIVGVSFVVAAVVEVVVAAVVEAEVDVVVEVDAVVDVIAGETCADQSSVPAKLFAAIKKRLPPAAVRFNGVCERLPSSIVPAAVPSLCQTSGPLDEP